MEDKREYPLSEEEDEVPDVENVISRAEIRKITSDMAEELIQLGKNCNLNYLIKEMADRDTGPVDAVTAAMTEQTQFFLENYKAAAARLVGNVDFLVNVEYNQIDRLAYFPLVPQHLVGHTDRKRDIAVRKRRAPYE